MQRLYVRIGVRHQRSIDTNKAYISSSWIMVCWSDPMACKKERFRNLFTEEIQYCAITRIYYTPLYREYPSKSKDASTDTCMLIRHGSKDSPGGVLEELFTETWQGRDRSLHTGSAYHWSCFDRIRRRFLRASAEQLSVGKLQASPQFLSINPFKAFGLDCVLQLVAQLTYSLFPCCSRWLSLRLPFLSQIPHQVPCTQCGSLWLWVCPQKAFQPRRQNIDEITRSVCFADATSVTERKKSSK